MVAGNVVLLRRGGAIGALPNLLAGFEGPVQGGAKRGEKEKKKRDGSDVVAVTSSCDH